VRIYDPIHQPSLSARGVLLARDNVKIIVGQEIVQGKAEVRFLFLPDLRLRIKVNHLQGNLSCLINLPPVQIIFSSGHKPVDVLLTKVTLRGTNSFAEAIQSRDFVLIGARKSVARIAFSLFNFVEFLWSDSHQSEQGIPYRTIVLETNEWRIQLNQLPDVHERLERLKRTGGFIMTHAGNIERVDNKPTTAKAAEKIERGLGLFLSFVRGCFCHPALSCGIARTGKKVWEKWKNPLNEDTWTATLSAVIYWYCRSNPVLSGSDGSLILAQTGLERLAWTYLVESKKSLSPDGFSKFSAADQIRLLLSQCGIPLEVPPSLSPSALFRVNTTWMAPG
jgi:hypothetical protein